MTPPLESRLADAALSKARRRLIPFLFVLYLVAYLDRINVGFASLQMNRELGLTESVFGLGAGLFFLGYSIFEVPSNLILERVGARLWIARIMISWGVVAMAMIAVRGAASFFALRFVLGLAEAGFFPGVILYLTFWFPAREQARCSRTIHDGDCARRRHRRSRLGRIARIARSWRGCPAGSGYSFSKVCPR